MIRSNKPFLKKKNMFFIKNPNFSLTPIPIILIIINFCSLITTAADKNCERSCGKNHLPYPFGFSPTCEIPLNCSHAKPGFSRITLGDFPVHSIDNDSIKITIEAKCNRPLHALRRLYSANHAPTSRNAILFENCTRLGSSCRIPSTLAYTNFEASPCTDSNKTNIGCYTEDVSKMFLDYDKVVNYRCRYLWSSIFSSDSFVSDSFTKSTGLLELQVVELGWWLEGDCDHSCDENADCIKISSTPTGQDGFRCHCRKKFVGDGYRAGEGCRKVSSTCAPTKYMSGQCGGTTRLAVLIGGILAGAFIMICGVLLCCCIRRRSNSKSRNIKRKRLTETTGITIPIYPYKDIEKATNNFSEKQRLGTGAYGTVYSGKLNKNCWVAIKRIKNNNIDNNEQVINEIKLISTVNHPNLVQLLGCSIENGEQILVYEFMPNGTLSQHLHREKGDALPWPVRLTICVETAEAIAYLHSKIDPPIYHRDIKSSNILLDFDFKSKVADFGLSRLGLTEISHISTAPQGTPGYLDPQYHQNFHLSDKSDVYSFGVVLVEIITALKVVDFSRPYNEVNLASVAIDRIGKGRLIEIIDPVLEPQTDDWTLLSIHKVAELAFRCLAFHRDMRPSMVEVADELEAIRLSRSVSGEVINCSTTLSDLCSSSSSCSSSCNVSERPLNEHSPPFSSNWLLENVVL